MLIKSIAKFLNAVDRIHRRFQSLDILFILLKQGYALPQEPFNSPTALGRMIRRIEEGLELPILKSVAIHSPGTWEIIGSLSPFNFIKDMLEQFHEHKKDKCYRNDAEKISLWLDNEYKRNEIIKQRIEILKSSGVSEEEIRKYFIRPMLSSAKMLMQTSESGVIDPLSAEIETENDSGE